MLKKRSTYIKVILGSAIYAIGFRYFLYPNDIVPGGVSGVAMIVNYITALPVGIVALALNVPIFIAAWRSLGKDFLIASLIGAVASSLAIDVCGWFYDGVTKEPLLGAVFGGLITGFGLGLVFSVGASTGGTDVIAQLLRKKFPYMNMGNMMLIVDCVVIVCGAFILRSFDSAMYAVISVFISSKMIDGVLYGFSFSKVCYIISDRPEEIRDKIYECLDRGVTMLEARGGYSGDDKLVIMCAVKRQQTAELKRLVAEIDRNAFMIFSEAYEVFGEGFEGVDSQ